MTDFQKVLQDSLIDQTNKMKAERLEKERLKKLKYQMLFLLVEIIISISGFSIIIYHLGWWVALGVWLLFWSNNFQMLRQVGEKNKLIEFWKKDNDKD